MKCVYCAYIGSHVVDSRMSEDGSMIRRRRECEMCNRRFTTYEKADAAPLMVIKKDETRQPYDADKLRAGIIKACEKRPVSIKQIDDIVEEIERQAYLRGEQELPAKWLGDMVMDALKRLDEVAYVRFSCVYHQFRDLQTFVDELSRLINEKKDHSGNADE